MSKIFEADPAPPVDRVDALKPINSPLCPRSHTPFDSFTSYISLATARKSIRQTSTTELFCFWRDQNVSHTRAVNLKTTDWRYREADPIHSRCQGPS